MRRRLFGRDAEGRAVEEVTLESADAAVSILGLGCITRDWRIDGPKGSLPVVLGFPRLEDYLHHARSHGMIVGRVANRTANSSFTLEGRTHALTPNEGAHHLHGGPGGLGKRIWQMEPDSASGTLYLFYTSPDGEEGYPGRVDFSVSVRLEGPRLIMEMAGRPDRPTPVNLANHNYYNLGGTGGLGKRIWQMEPDSASGTLYLFYTSPDGEEGYPGRVDFSVSVRLEGPRLIMEMAGRPDRPTPVNLANHNYYNLGGTGTVKDHQLWVDATGYTPTDADLIPTGEIRPVEGTEYDFTTAREVGDARLDINLVLNPGRDRKRPSARAHCPRSGATLEMWTDEPGLQLFDAFAMEIGTPGHDGQTYGRHAGLCLEAQHLPDSLHNPDWPSIIATPDTPYFQRLVVEIARPK